MADDDSSSSYNYQATSNAQAFDNDSEEPDLLTKMSPIQFLKRHGYWTPLIKAIKYIIHFIVVILSLFGGALVFAVLEDPEIPDTEINANSTLRSKNSSDYNAQLWNELETEYNISVPGDARDEFLKKFESFIKSRKEREARLAYLKQNKDRKFIFLKWLYFVTITTTTIGYGDVSPQTDNGKIFCMGFLVIGIILMMTLLASSGAIITALNTKCYGFVNKHVCRGKQFVSKELLSAITITLLFCGYLALGIWYQIIQESGTKHASEWPLVHTIYFWIVTFSTVGYGDMLFSLDKEIEHIYVLIIFRVFGLAFIAGIIDSFYEYCTKKQIEIREKTQQMYEMQAQKLMSGKLMSFVDKED